MGGFTAFVVKERMLYDTFFTQKRPQYLWQDGGRIP